MLLCSCSSSNVHVLPDRFDSLLKQRCDEYPRLADKATMSDLIEYALEGKSAYVNCATLNDAKANAIEALESN